MGPKGLKHDKSDWKSRKNDKSDIIRQNLFLNIVYQI
jgi:hypothetical protein